MFTELGELFPELGELFPELGEMFPELGELFPGFRAQFVWARTQGPPTTCMSWERCAVPLQVVSASGSALLRPGERSYDSTLPRLGKRTATTTTVLLLLLLPTLQLLLLLPLHLPLLLHYYYYYYYYSFVGFKSAFHDIIPGSNLNIKLKQKNKITAQNC